MNNKKTIFEKKIQYITKNIRSNEPIDKISVGVDNVIEYINNNFTGYDFLECFDILLEELTKVDIKDEKYFTLIIKNLYNAYFRLIGLDSFAVWSILLSKIFTKRVHTVYPTVYGYLFNILVYTNKTNYFSRDLEFPLTEDINLFDIVKIFEKNILGVNATSLSSLSSYNSYNLFFQEKFADKVFFFLLNFFERQRSIHIWFPFSGVGIEPLYFANLFEAMKIEKSIDGNFNIYCSGNDSDIEILEQGLKLPQIKSRVKEHKNNFMKRYGFTERDIGKARKRIFVHKKAHLEKSNFLKKINFIVISLGLQIDENFKKSISTLLDEFKNINNHYSIIVEVEGSFKFEIGEKKFGNFILTNIICGEFAAELNDKHITYLLFEFVRGTKQNSSVELIEYLYEKCRSSSPQDIKRELKNIQFNKLRSFEAILIAELLEKAGKYSKAFDLIKNNFNSDYRNSYSILNNIQAKCKNKKLTKQVLLFTEENHLLEHSFSAELLDTITNEIDRYFVENPESILNKKKWL